MVEDDDITVAGLLWAFALWCFMMVARLFMAIPLLAIAVWALVRGMQRDGKASKICCMLWCIAADLHACCTLVEVRVVVVAC